MPRRVNPKNPKPTPLEATKSIQDAVIAARVIQGEPLTKIAEELGVSYHGLRDRVGSARFQREIAAMKAELIGAIQSGLVQGARVGVNTLVDAAANASGDVPWQTRVSAAKALVDATVGTRVNLGLELAPTLEESPLDRLRERLEDQEARIIEVGPAASSG